MSKVVTVRGCRIELIGSVHSSLNALEALRSSTPKHIFIESDRNMLARIKRKEIPSHVRDLPAVVEHALAHDVTVHPIDISQDHMVAEVFHGIPKSHIRKIWRWSVISKLLGPASLRSFLWLPNDFTRRAASRWGIAAPLLTQIRDMQESGVSLDDIALYVSSKSHPDSFLANPDYDPEEYVQLCSDTAIDQRLQAVLIHYRNNYMCHQIRRLLNIISEGSTCAVVVGENHVRGMLDNLQQGDDYVPEGLAPPGVESGRPSRVSDRLLLSLLLSSWV